MRLCFGGSMGFNVCQIVCDYIDVERSVSIGGWGHVFRNVLLQIIQVYCLTSRTHRWCTLLGVCRVLGGYQFTEAEFY